MLKNQPSYEVAHLTEGEMMLSKTNSTEQITDFPGLEMSEMSERNTEKLEKISDEITTTLDAVMEAVSPKWLRTLSQDVISATISHNNYAKKHLNSERVERAYQAIEYLLTRWIPLHTAVGIISNAVAESGLDTTKKPSWLGLFQWIGARQKKFYQMQSKLDGTNELEKQLSYMLWELENTEIKAGNLLKGARTAQEASRIFLVHFERPRVKNIDERSAIATGLLQLTDNNMNLV